MNRFRFALLAIVVLAVTVGAVTAASGNGDEFEATLDGFQETPAVSTVATGTFRAELNRDSIEFRLRYSDLEGVVLFAHIHLGQSDVAGGVSAFLCGGGTKPPCPQSGRVRGTITASDVIGPEGQGIAAGEFAELAAAMQAGVTYANVHTDKFPGGEIRGQIGQENDD